MVVVGSDALTMKSEAITFLKVALRESVVFGLHSIASSWNIITFTRPPAFGCKDMQRMDHCLKGQKCLKI